MENENNNYSFTPITEDNSVNEIKDDFFGGSNPEPSTATNNEVPPILEVPQIKEEETPVASSVTEPLASDAVTPEDNVPAVPENINESVPAEPVQKETSVAEPITEVNAPVADTPSEPVEVKIPEGLDEEPKEETPALVTEPVSPSAEPVVNNPEPVAVSSENPSELVSNPESAPVVEQPAPKIEQVNNHEPQPDAPKKGRSIFDFFKNKENPNVDSSNNEPTPEKPVAEDPFNNFVVDAPESVTPLENPVAEPVIENPKSTIEAPLPNIEEPTPVIGETIPAPKVEIEEPKEEVSLPNVDESIPEPVIEPITNEENELPTFNNVENNFESVKEPEPIVKEVVVEKEKVVLGKKCPNCGEVTAETFCPNCGFLVE